MSDLISRINKEIHKVVKRGDIPTKIWLGKEEKYELERLMQETETRDTSLGSKNEICGLPFSFVSSEKWLTISYEEVS